ncbi:hypothetical protein [Streptomyces sp. NPDC088554]|uniref:hypothetical protein n=1 Tax=Streptomyces sp. NPDC088554 TaxID=3365865 RepID=UPI0037F452A9
MRVEPRHLRRFLAIAIAIAEESSAPGAATRPAIPHLAYLADELASGEAATVVP